MRSFSPKFINSLKFTGSHLAHLKKIGEFRGKQNLFSKKSPEALQVLKQHAIIESVESSNRLEQITAPRKRIAGLVNKSTTPKNRSENEISGYRNALDLIHESYKYMDISVNIIKQLHTIIYRHLQEDGGKFKSIDNKIIEKDPSGEIIRERFKPIPAFQASQAMDELCQNYMDFLSNTSTDTLILLPLFILDFLCVHPFKDGNGRVSRLVTLLILQKQGYEVGKYISLERIFEESKEGYYSSLQESSQGWHSSNHNPLPWIEYFWGVLIRAYKEYEGKVNLIKETLGGKGSKTEQIKCSIRNKIVPFSISDIEKDCSGISLSMIRNVLRQLRDEGEIQSQGVGRNAKWKINPSVTFKLGSSGHIVENAKLLVLFSNNTWKSAITNKNGVAKIYLYSTKKPVTIFVASENHLAFFKKKWIPIENILTIELKKATNGGSVIFEESTGYIPGLKGRLNPILDTSNRTYLYADNIAINGGKQQPVNFQLGKDLHLQDSNGIEKMIYILEIKGKSSLLEYKDV